MNTTKAHPLNRIADGVFAKQYSEAFAIEIAKAFIEHGSNIDGGELIEKKDTPLIAAVSLYADQLAIFYIEQKANINHAGCHGGTALHWAAWCGRDKVVDKLIQSGTEINKLCIDFNATPLFWAVHGLKSGGNKNLQNYLKCIKVLMQAGADTSIPNTEGKTVFDLLNNEDLDLKEALNSYFLPKPI
jgi:ankyrin repeat protein